MVIHACDPTILEDHEFKPNLGTERLRETLSQNPNKKAWGCGIVRRLWVQSPGLEKRKLANLLQGHLFQAQSTVTQWWHKCCIWFFNLNILIILFNMLQSEPGSLTLKVAAMESDRVLLLLEGAQWSSGKNYRFPSQKGHKNVWDTTKKRKSTGYQERWQIPKGISNTSLMVLKSVKFHSYLLVNIGGGRKHLLLTGPQKPLFWR